MKMARRTSGKHGFSLLRAISHTYDVANIFIVPAWGQKADSNWYRSLEKVLLEKYPNTKVSVLDTPPTTIEAQVASIKEAVDASSADLKSSFFIAHSVGCQGVMRYLASNEVDKDKGVGGIAFVAGWWTIDIESDVPHRPEWLKDWLSSSGWAELQPWIETPFDVKKGVSERLLGCRTPGGKGKSLVFISDDDPFTVDVERNKREWEEKLPEARVVICPGNKHFNDADLPAEVVDQIVAAIAVISY